MHKKNLLIYKNQFIHFKTAPIGYGTNKMSLTITGRLVQILKTETGDKKNGGMWSKTPIIIETNEQYPKKVCIEFWGDKAATLSNFQVGQTVDVGINIESREANGRWFTSIQGWKIYAAGSVDQDIQKSVEQGANTPSTPQPVDDLPF